METLYFENPAWRLTTRHGSSSNGIPVLVDSKGNAWGAGDVVFACSCCDECVTAGDYAMELYSGIADRCGLEEFQFLRSFLGPVVAFKGDSESALTGDS